MPRMDSPGPRRVSVIVSAAIGAPQRRPWPTDARTTTAGGERVEEPDDRGTREDRQRQRGPHRRRRRTRRRGSHRGDARRAVVSTGNPPRGPEHRACRGADGSATRAYVRAESPNGSAGSGHRRGPAAKPHGPIGATGDPRGDRRGGASRRCTPNGREGAGGRRGGRAERDASSNGGRTTTTTVRRAYPRAAVAGRATKTRCSGSAIGRR